MIATSENLDTFMEFDWTYHVDEEGRMTEALDVHGPDVFVQEEGGKPIVTLGWGLLKRLCPFPILLHLFHPISVK